MKLEDIVAGLDEADQARVTAAVELLEVQAAGSAALQGEVETLRKADDSPVTVVDLLHQAQVQGLLAEHFPGDGLISEEPRSLQEQVFGAASELSLARYGIDLGPTLARVPDQGPYTWIVDPIDGTKGFVAGRYFAIAIGYFAGVDARFGALAVPGRDDTGPELAIDGAVAFALAGRGAWIRRPRLGESWSRIEPAPAAGQRVRVAVSLAHGGALAGRVRAAGEVEVVAMDSQAKYLGVATGEIDAYLRAARDDGQSDVVWDHMPAGLVAREAGCRLEHFDGGEIDFAPERSIAFRGGFACYRDRGEVGACVGRLLAR
jgi:3'-phosphoadenosine 5'-phosphosulfate (PAPS) 3'-phosphatase